MRSALKSMCAMRSDWEVCGEATDGQEAVAKASKVAPDLIILDFKMPPFGGLQTAVEIAAILPAIPIVMYTLYKTDGLERAAKSVGVRSVVAKTDGIRDLLRAIDAELPPAPAVAVGSCQESDYKAS